MMADLNPAAQIAEAAQQVASKRNRLLSTPALVMITLFGIGPLLLILIYSFLKAAPYGGVEWKFSTDAYLNFLFQRDIFDDTLQFSPDYLYIYARSIGFALITTIV